jgi:hypothetical protein
MSKTSYEVEPSAEDAGALLEHTRIRMNFAIMAKGNCQPDITVETIVPPFPDDDTLVRLAILNSKALTIATMLGRHFERVYANWGAWVEQADQAAFKTMPEQEEIEGWLVRRTT